LEHYVSEIIKEQNRLALKRAKDEKKKEKVLNRPPKRKVALEIGCY